jgi:glucose uptake protein GlcU
MLVLILMWLIRYLVCVCQTRSHRDAFYALPSFHIQHLLLPGFLSGSLYSIGHICSILSVSYLGQGVGFSVIQSSLLISGLWGIFYYREIRGLEMILKWFCAAALTLIGIVWLTYEHEGGASGSH